MYPSKIRKEKLNGRLILRKNLRAFRKEQGFSQEKFAFKCCLDRSYVGAIERGEVNVSIDNIERLSLALDKEIHELLIENKT